MNSSVSAFSCAPSSIWHLQFITDELITYLAGPVPILPRGRESTFAAISTLAQVSKLFRQQVAASTLFRDTYRLLTTTAVQRYSRGQDYPGFRWHSWNGEIGLLPCFSYDVISKSLHPPTSYLKVLKMLVSMDCEGCGKMTVDASPLTLTRLCGKCNALCDEALCTSATTAKELCLLTDKDLVGIPFFDTFAGAAGMAFCPKALYSALGVSNKCMDKYGGLVAFRAEVEKRRLKAKQKYDDSQASDKPQKKRSKLEHASLFNGDIKNLVSVFGNTMPCGFVALTDPSYRLLNPDLDCFLATAPCSSSTGISGDFVGTKFATLMQSTSGLHTITPTEAMAVGVSANRELVDLLATATDIVFCIDHPQGHLNPGVRNTIHTGRFSLKSANCGGEDCVVKIMVVNDTRFMDYGVIFGGYFCLVAQVNNSRPAIFFAEGCDGLQDLGFEASMGQMQSVFNKLGLTSCNLIDFSAAVVLLFRKLVTDMDVHPLVLAPFARMMALNQYMESWGHLSSLLTKKTGSMMRDIGQVLKSDWVVLDGEEGEGYPYNGDY
jgi:hypothetical protein